MAATESELGHTEDVRALVLGDQDALGGTVAHLRVLSDALRRAAAGLARTDVGSWSGEAAEAFRSRFAGAPAQWAAAAAAFERAATAWAAYAQVVGWAQGRAGDAVALFRSGVAASEEAVAARARAEASAPAGAALPPFVDPGAASVGRAREILADARRQRDLVGAEAGSAVAAAAARAPDPPSGWDRVGADLSDSLGALGTEGAHVVGGLVDSTVALAGLIHSVNPLDPYNAAHPARYLDAVSTTAAGVVTGALHPIRMVNGLLGTGWGSDPARAAGEAIPRVVAAVAIGGLGRSAIGMAERVEGTAAPAVPAGPVPRGFAGAEDFGRFGARLHEGLARAGFPDTGAAVQGSAATGRSFTTGEAFDLGRSSDYDIALGGKGLFDAAEAAGIGLRSAGSRTGPLRDIDLDLLGLSALRHELSEMAGREVNLMIYRELDGALRRSHSIGVPRS